MPAADVEWDDRTDKRKPKNKKHAGDPFQSGFFKDMISGKME
jgi:hypothetical protein